MAQQNLLIVKNLLFTLIPITLLITPIPAQEPAQEEPNTVSQDVVIATGSEAKIIGPISDGTPSAPAPKPEPINFEVQTSRTTTTHVVEAPEMPGLPAPEGRINITVQRVKDPGLPDPPPPLPQLPPDDATVQARLQELTAKYHKTQLAFVSATVYDHNRTYFRCYPNGAAKHEICGWSNLDFNHFSGFASFEAKGTDETTRQYGMLMGIGNENTRKMAAWMAEHDREYKIPDCPQLPDFSATGPAFVLTQADPDDTEAMELVQGMHNLYKAEGAKMEVAYKARVKAYEERKAYLLANPPKPKDVSIQFWKRESPTQTQGEP